MPSFDPELLADWTGGRWTRRPAGPISGFSHDTRQILPGLMFIALKTEQRDGHDFLPAAEAAGASAALVARAQFGTGLPQLVVADPLTSFQAAARAHRRRFPGPVVGVTGSAGKTSTKDLLARLLGDRVLATEGNRNNHLGVPLTLARLEPATHDYAVIEAGISAPGEMAPLAAMIEPTVAVVTLVSPAHLHELGDLEGVAAEKAQLAAAVGRGGLAVFPKSCAEFAAFRALKVRTIAVGPPPSAVSFTVAHGPEGTDLNLAGDLPEGGRFRLPPVSDGMAQNAALALTTALHLGLPRDVLRPRLLGWRPAAWRGEWREEAGRTVYLDCYNANPASMTDALAVFVREAPAGRPRLFILGGMEELGRESARYHEELGRRVPLRLQDRLCLIGGPVESVRSGALAVGARPDQIILAASIEEAAACLGGFEGAVFIKGSRRYQLERLVGAAAH